MERKNILVAVFIFVTAVVVPGTGQVSPELKIDKVAPVSGMLSPLALQLPVKCSDRNLYLRVYDRHQSEHPIFKVATDSMRFVRILPADVEGMKDSFILDFTPDPVGGLDVLVGRAVKEKTEYEVLHFDEDGKYGSKVKLQMAFRPEHIAKFRSGTFLIAGQEKRSTPEGNTSQGGKANLSLFDHNGHYVRPVVLKGDAGHPPDNSKSEDVAEYDRNAMISVLEVGPSGNAFLLRPPDTMFIVSPSGDVINVVRPKLREKTFLMAAKLGKGSAVFVFGQRKAPGDDGISRGIARQYFVEHDIFSGERLAEYSSSDPALGAALACYSPDSYVFVRPGARGILDVVWVAPGQ